MRSSIGSGWNTFHLSGSELCFAAADAVHGFPLGFPLDLETGLGVMEGIVFQGQDFEEFALADLLLAPLEVFLVIGHE